MSRARVPTSAIAAEARNRTGRGVGEVLGDVAGDSADGAGDVDAGAVGLGLGLGDTVVPAPGSPVHAAANSRHTTAAADPAEELTPRRYRSTSVG